MKRVSRLIIVTLMIVMLASSVCFAGNLEIIENYPEDGSKNAAVENFGVKLYFNEDIYDTQMDASKNEKCFVIRDENGKKVPTMVVYSPKEKNMVLVLAEQNSKDKDGFKIQPDTEYTLTISDEMTSVKGSEMAKAQEITFKTLNQQRATMINMILMTVMFAGIFLMNLGSQKKEIKKKIQDDKVNPYKVAKETGRSVEEIVAADQKAKKKKADKAAWKAMLESDDDEEVDCTNDNKRVKGPRPISAGGSTYVTGRKALAEKRKAEQRAKGTTKPKHKGGNKKK